MKKRGARRRGANLCFSTLSCYKMWYTFGINRAAKKPLGRGTNRSRQEVFAQSGVNKKFVRLRRPLEPSKDLGDRASLITTAPARGFFVGLSTYEKYPKGDM